MSKDFRKAVKLVHRLDVPQLTKIISLSSMLIQEAYFHSQICECQNEDESVEVKLDRPLTEVENEKDYDLDDHDPSVPTPTKEQLDIDLIRYRIRDPRLTTEEKKQIALEILNLKPGLFKD